MNGELAALTNRAEKIREAIDTLIATAAVADVMQWEKAPVESDVDEETKDRKATRGPSDPTGDAAVDDRRLGVRETMIRCERLLYDMQVAALATTVALKRAMDVWEGDTPDDTPVDTQ